MSESEVRTESELESRLSAALSAAFPNIARDDFKEQRRFTMRLGRQTMEYDSAAGWEKGGRADILIFHGERPLAVVEVKRENLKLTNADYEQAQSYANQVTPRPPLVIVTNGSDTRIYDASTGKPWSHGDNAASTVQRLLSNAAKVAAADMRWAVEALMGRETGVWVPIVRATSDALLEEMTDEPGESARPFTRNLLFPRLATAKALEALSNGSLFTIVEGAPNAGKSSLLRELVLQTRESEELAVLMMRSTGPGLFQSLANLFAAQLEWNLTADNARHWLRRMSNGNAGPILVVAIDSVDPGTPMASDLEELERLNPGNRLRIIITTDQPDALVMKRNNRTLTALGTHAARVEIGPLGLEEFRLAVRTLQDNKVHFMEGSEYAEDYRAPWVLRTLYDRIASHANFADPTKAALLPPTLGLDLVDAARAAYSGQSDSLRGYRLLARDALRDTDASPDELALMASHCFVIRQDVLSAETREMLTDLRDAGWARIYRHTSGEDIVVPAVPAAFFVELADAIGVELSDQAEADPYCAGIWLGQRLSGVYLGDLLGAQAIRSMADKTGEFSSGIISGLLSIKPEEELVERSLIGLTTESGEILHIKIKDGKAWLSNRHGEELGGPVDLGAERSRMYANTTPWMILGQLARLPTAVVGDDNMRIDASLLLEIGQCPFPLMRANEAGQGFLVHDIDGHGQVLCLDHGPIEPMTQAMADMLSRHWTHADEWVDTAIESGSLPLLQRVLIALHTVQARNVPEQSEWAGSLAKNRLVPAINAVVPLVETERQSSAVRTSALE